MKKIGYLFIGLLMMGFGINGVFAKEAPTFSSTFQVTNVDSDTINISAIVKNTVTTCNDTGVKNGYVYIYLNSDEIFTPANLSGIATYRNYNETTQNFTDLNVLCSYDSTEKAIKCNFGRVTTPSLINYSDCKDEMKINFTADMCAGKADCSVKIAVKGEAIDYNNGNPISISGGTTTLHEKTYTCSSSTVNNSTSNPINDTTVVENPNTLDSTSMYFIIGLVSFIFMCVLLKPNKKSIKA